ncbi:protein TolR [Thiohalophilus sp.]|uniref:protein TolR n=1 Tax=Thiohalophilus sp. TaxID=3028392 RepID=UPI002ACE8D1B|nr:protein TolR [Thiohalophilus sp.]MDZ7663456.1 protein TolR [Thiohalophilus sp.]
MRVIAGRVKHKRMSEINVVPYIDVMLVLLIIFMVTAPLLSQGVEVSLPQSGARTLEETQEEPLVVSVNREGDYFLNLGEQTDTPLAAEALVQRVRAVLRQRSDKTVYIKGDRDASYGHVVAVMATLQEAGVRDLGLVTRSPDESDN